MKQSYILNIQVYFKVCSFYLFYKIIARDFKNLLEDRFYILIFVVNIKDFLFFHMYFLLILSVPPHLPYPCFSLSFFFFKGQVSMASIAVLKLNIH